jgi:hypothetical protein
MKDANVTLPSAQLQPVAVQNTSNDHQATATLLKNPLQEAA